MTTPDPIAEARKAWERLNTNYPYVPWQSAGGPEECAHGYAKGIPCRECDRITVGIALTAHARLAEELGRVEGERDEARCEAVRRVLAAESARDAALSRLAHLERELRCERGEWAPEGWARNDFDPGTVGLAWYRTANADGSPVGDTVDGYDRVCWVHRAELPALGWVWEVERNEDGVRFCDPPVAEGIEPTALAAIEAADRALVDAR